MYRRRKCRENCTTWGGKETLKCKKKIKKNKNCFGEITLKTFSLFVCSLRSFSYVFLKTSLNVVTATNYVIYLRVQIVQFNRVKVSFWKRLSRQVLVSNLLSGCIIRMLKQSFVQVQIFAVFSPKGINLLEHHTSSSNGTFPSLISSRFWT